MKILRANIYFVLPEDFDGDFNEALELWTLHKDFANGPSRAPFTSEMSSAGMLENHEQGFKTMYQAGIWSNETGSWKCPTEICVVK